MVHECRGRKYLRQKWIRVQRDGGQQVVELVWSVVLVSIILLQQGSSRR